MTIVSSLQNQHQVSYDKALIEIGVASLVALPTAYCLPTTLFPYYLTSEVIDYTCYAFNQDSKDWSLSEEYFFQAILSASTVALSILGCPKSLITSVGIAFSTQTTRKHLISSKAFQHIKEQAKDLLKKSAKSIKQMGIKTALLGCCISACLIHQTEALTFLEQTYLKDFSYLQDPYMRVSMMIGMAGLWYVGEKNPLQVSKDIYLKYSAHGAALALTGTIGSAAIFALGSHTKAAAAASLSIGSITYLITQNAFIASAASVASQILLESTVVQSALTKASGTARHFLSKLWP